MGTVISWEEISEDPLFDIATFKITRWALIKDALVVGKFLLRILYEKVFTFVN